MQSIFRGQLPWNDEGWSSRNVRPWPREEATEEGVESNNDGDDDEEDAASDDDAVASSDDDKDAESLAPQRRRRKRRKKRHRQPQNKCRRRVENSSDSDIDRVESSGRSSSSDSSVATMEVEAPVRLSDIESTSSGDEGN